MRLGALLGIRRRGLSDKLLQSMNAGGQLSYLLQQLLEFRLRYLHSSPDAAGPIMQEIRGVFTLCLQEVTAKDTYSFRNEKAQQLRRILIALG